MTVAKRMLRRAGPLMVLALALAACGRAGSLEPPGSTEQMTKTPSLIEIPLGNNSLTRKPEPVKAPDKPFILDPLL